MAKIEILKCHYGSIELELTLQNGFENLRNVIVQFVAKGTQ